MIGMGRAMLLGLMVAAAPALVASSPQDSFAIGAWSHETNMISAKVPGYPEWLIKMTRSVADPG
jgi:hypothetical protein